MPKAGYRNEFAYSDDISFGRLFLGIGPKTVKQPIKPKPTVHAVQPPPQRVVLTLGGKMYSVADVRRTTAVAPPAPAPAVVETAEPAPAAPPASVEAPAPEPPAAAPEPAAATPPAPDAEAAAEVPAWTDVQDALLLGLKALNKTWKEIGAMVEGKDTEDLRDRYAELTAVKTKGKKAEAAEEEANTPETTEEEGEGKKGGDKKNNKKDKKQNKKKGDKGEASNQENNDEEATKKDKQGRKLRGILKLDEATDEGAAAGQPDSDDEPQFYRGHPVIYVDDEDGLSARELHHLYKYYQRLESYKWLQLSSKLLDKTGKRVPAEVLKEKFKNLSL